MEKLMLWGFGLSMKMMYTTASIMDKKFRDRLKERDIHIVFKTIDGKSARTYSLIKGKIKSVGKAHEDPDLCVSFSNITDMIAVLFSVAPKAVIKAGFDTIRHNKLKVEFKVEPFVWLSNTFIQMLLVYTDRSRPKKFLFMNA